MGKTDQVREKSNQKADVEGGQCVKVITNIYWGFSAGNLVLVNRKYKEI